MGREIRCERPRGRPRRGVLPDRREPVEHPRADVTVTPDREEVERLGVVGGRAHPLAPAIITRGAAERLVVGDRHHEMRYPGRHRHDRQPVDEITELEPGGGGNRLPIVDLPTEDGRKLPHHRATTVEVDPHRDVAGRAMLHRLAADQPFARERERRAEGRVARERQLHLRREDPDVVSGGAHGRDEGGLGEPDLHREGLHRRVVEPDRHLRHHAELVPAERSLGEDVDQPERHAHGSQPIGGLCWAAPRV